MPNIQTSFRNWFRRGSKTPIAKRVSPLGRVIEQLEDRTTPATINFAPNTNYAVGTNPWTIAVGDFNGDGKNDLVTANRTSANVTVLLGTGTGSFGAATNFAVGTDPYTVVVGDFNGDGKSDLAVANFGSSNVSVLLGNGAGGFGAAANFAVGINPTSVAVGDFNGDGKSDFATSNYGSNNVSVLLGNGAGGFGAPTSYAVGINPFSIALGDFNGDGKTDLTTANTSSNTVSVLLGTGTGTFGAATNFAAGSTPDFVTVADINGDGKTDLITANFNSDSVNYLFGTGTGSFGPATNFGISIGTYPRAVKVADIDGDGKSDLVIASSGATKVDILVGDGAGGFVSATNIFWVDSGPFSVAVADFNGDGKTDIATANYHTNNITVLLNITGPANSAPTALSMTKQSLAENAGANAAVGNFNTTDPDTGNTFTYTFATGTGDTNNALFNISGNQLRANASFDYEAGSSYTVRIRTTDQGGLFKEQNFVISVTNVSEISGFDVQHGATQRSFVRYLDIDFASAADVVGLGQVKLTRYNLDGSGGTVVAPAPGVITVSGNRMSFDFGIAGIGGNQNTNAGDGYYTLSFDLDNNGSFESKRSFYRLFGDLNGDRTTANNSDYAILRADFTLVGSNLEGDMNGDGIVNAADYTLFRRIFNTNVSLGAGLTVDD